MRRLSSILKELYAGKNQSSPRKSESPMLTALAALTALAGLVKAILKYFPAKSDEEKKVEERSDAVARYHSDTQDFEKNRDTSKLGDFD